MSPCPPPSPEDVRPSSSEAFPAEEGWVWCPPPFDLEGIDATWYWNSEKKCFGLSAHTHRFFPGIGSVAVTAGLLQADTLDPGVAVSALDQVVHELVTLMAME